MTVKFTAIIKIFIVAVSLMIFLAPVPDVFATPSYDLFNQVLISEDGNLIIYPRFELFASLPYLEQLTQVDDLVYAGTSEWWVPTVNELEEFFGGQSTIGNPGLNDIGNMGISYKLRTSTESVPGEHIVSDYFLDEVTTDSDTFMDSGMTTDLSIWAMASTNTNNTNQTPEPSTLLTLVIGLLGVGFLSLKYKHDSVSKAQP